MFQPGNYSDDIQSIRGTLYKTREFAAVYSSYRRFTVQKDVFFHNNVKKKVKNTVKKKHLPFIPGFIPALTVRK